LAFDLPDQATRKKMLASWLPDLPGDKLTEIVGSTKGYSGAHLYELVQFAKSLQEEGKTLDTALTDALTKIAEQKKLIDNPVAYERDSGGRYDDAMERSITSLPLIQKYTARGAFKRHTKALLTKTEKTRMPLDDLVGGKPPETKEPPYDDAEGEGDEGEKEVQAVLLAKDKFADEATVTAWLTEHDFKIDMLFPPEEAEEHWVAIQFEAQECEPDSAEREELEEGVLTVCCTKGESTDDDPLDDTEDELETEPEPKTLGKGIARVAKVTAKKNKKLAPNDGPPLEDNPDLVAAEEGESNPKMPYGAEVVTNLHKHLCSVCQYCEDAVGLLEHPAVQKTVEKLKGAMEVHRDAVKEFGSATYPDHFQESEGDESETEEEEDAVKPEDEDEEDMGADEEVSEDEDSEGDDDDGDELVPDEGVGADDGPGPEEADDESEEDLEDDLEEDEPKPAKKKRPKLADEKHLLISRTKMSQKDLGGVLEAAEFLDELSGEDNLKKSQKAASRLHASELKGLHKKHSATAKEPNTDEVSKSELKAFATQLKRTQDLMYAITGEDY
jgi:hypothetical protein